MSFHRDSLLFLTTLTLSTKDGLTGVWNQHQFDEQLSVAWKHIAKNHTPLSLILIENT
jgi:PleD family two-component response regulator